MKALHTSPAARATLLLILAVLASCTHKDLGIPESGSLVEARITTAPATRATNGVYWNNDKIGVMVIAPAAGQMASDYLNVGYKVKSTANDGTTAEFASISGSIYFEESDEVTFAAYAPYVEAASAATLPGTDGVISGDTSSQQTTQESVDYLYATGATASSDSPTVSFSGDAAFNHVMSMITIKLLAGDNITVSDISSGSVTLGGLVHTGTFDVTSGTAAVSSDSATDGWSVSSSCPSASTTGNLDGTDYDGIAYTAIIFPQNPDGLTLDISVADIDYDTLNFEIPTASDNPSGEDGYSAGYSYTYTFSVSKNSTAGSASGTITDWTSGGSFETTIGGGN